MWCGAPWGIRCSRAEIQEVGLTPGRVVSDAVLFEEAVTGATWSWP